MNNISFDLLDNPSNPFKQKEEFSLFIHNLYSSLGYTVFPFQEYLILEHPDTNIKRLLIFEYLIFQPMGVKNLNSLLTLAQSLNCSQIEFLTNSQMSSGGFITGGLHTITKDYNNKSITLSFTGGEFNYLPFTETYKPNPSKTSQPTQPNPTFPIILTGGSGIKYLLSLI